MSNPFRDEPLAPRPQPAAFPPPASSPPPPPVRMFPEEEQKGFPLSALFLGLSAAAAICGLIAPTFASEELDKPMIFIACAVWAGGVGLLCAIITFAATRSRQITLAITAAGAVVAGILPAVAMIPSDQFGKAVLTSTVGCGVMLVVAIIGRKKRQAKRK